MWGRLYWGRREEGGRKAEGVVVLFAWLSSEEKHLKPYVDLYWSLGWGCIICHVDFLTIFFPEKAATLARAILDELIKEVKVRPLPIVLAAFSGGSKGCLYKFLQLVDGKCEGQHCRQDGYQLVRLCLSGQMYDSSPSDFTSDVGVRFVLQPSILKLSHPPRVVTWMAKAFALSLDMLFINRFETERAEYWQTLYSSVSMGPFLILCSEDDELVSYKIVCGFAQHLKELGGDVNLMMWSNSPHVAHYRYHKAEYKAAVAEFLAKASQRYSNMQQLCRDSGEKMPESASNINNAALTVDDSLKRAAIGPPGLEVDETTEFFQLQYTRSEVVWSQIIRDVRAPRNIEDWDIKPVSTLNIRDWDMKCIKRSRL